MNSLNENLEEWINGEHNILLKVIKRVICKCVMPVIQRVTIQIEEQFLNIEKRMTEIESRTLKIEKLNEKLIQEIARTKLIITEPKVVHTHKGEDTLAINYGKKYYNIDYFDFENHFRGSRELILNRQKQYIHYFLGKQSVIDLGCGRGEFLELLSENNIGYIGVDSYREFVEYCNIRGLEAVCEDGFEYLKKIDFSDGIFVSQVVEHLELEQIIELVNLSYQKLVTGSYIIIETPNPKVLGIFANSFYIDPSHNKPVHPATLSYLLEKAGFNEIEIVFTEESKLPVVIPELHVTGSDNIIEFNESLKQVSDLLFGSQDYAVIAKR